MQTKGKIAFTVVVNVCRFVLALTLMASGFVKAVDPVGSMYKLQEYTSVLAVDMISDDWLLFFSIVQAAIEFLVGVFLFMGVYRKFMAALSFFIMLFFTLFAMFVTIDSTVEDCGCFGDAFALSNSGTLIKNIILLTLSAVVLYGSRRFVWCITSVSRWMVAIFSFFYIATVEGVSLSALPVLDFRPYAVGNNLREMIDDVPEVYELRHVYSKDGVTQEFVGDSLPDNSWTLVDTYSQLVSEGKQSLISDFAIIDWNTDEDIARGLLADTGYVCIVAIEFVDKAEVSRVDKINDLYDYCAEKGVPFFAATASSEDEILLWRRRTGAEYPIYWADNMMLRTMVRSNPGVLLLRDGVVAAKWDAAGIPDIDQFSQSPTGMPDKLSGIVDRMRGWNFWVIALFVPLGFIALFDFVVSLSRRRRSVANNAGKVDDKIEIVD